jgi:sugar/nucleoside kinase (ribokinase family)/D-arabinose 5-phosphate isomerase GutQ
MSENGDLDVVGIGSMAVDRFHRAPRILEAGEKGVLRDVEDAGPVREFVGGVVLNHLGWAAVLGLRTGLCGRQGDDAGGRYLRAAMVRTGIESDIYIDPEGASSTMAEIFVDDEGERAIYMAPGATSETTGEHVRKAHAEFIERARTLSTEVSQLPLDAVLAALAVARAAGARTVVDLDVPASDATATLGDEAALTAVLEAADLLKPAKIAGREFFPELADDALALARAIRGRFGNQAVVVTDGEVGCAISSDEWEGVVPAYVANAVDTTGAGDAFLGGLLVARHHELGWEDCGRFANACGAACVEQLGAFPEDPLKARARVQDFYSGTPFELSPADIALVTASSDASAATRVMEVVTRELKALAERLDTEALLTAAELIEASLGMDGRIHVTGLGKPEHVSHYAASLFSSTGTPATFLHATEATHGSLGQVVAGDVVIAISNSGTTRETVELAEILRDRDIRVIAVTGDPGSPLAEAADVVLEAGVTEEGGPLDLAPRASIVAETAVLAALSALLQDRAGFTRSDYADRHPAGALGARSRQ